jgi:diguanylate cyclase (GGDEF)-like protein
MKKREDEPTKPLPAADADPGIPEEGGDQACFLILNGVGSGRIVSLERDVTIGRDSSADIRLIDEWASRVHARVVPEGETVGIEDLDSTNGTMVNGERVTSRRELHDGDIVSVGSVCVLKFSYRGRLRQEFEQGLYDRASRDGLTGAYSRYFFDQYLLGELSYARRHQQPFAILFVEVDAFAEIYNTHGWVGCDFLLIELARTIGSMLREDDICARYGDTRFVILRRLVSIHQAISFGGHLRSDFAAEPLQAPNSANPLKVTLAVGVAHFPTHCADDSAAILPLAEKALQRAKDRGGNRVAMPEPGY